MLVAVAICWRWLFVGGGGCLLARWLFFCRSGCLLAPVLRIQIHSIHVFLALLDPDPDPLIRVMVRLWIRILIRILLSLSKNIKKNLDFYLPLFVTFFLLFIFQKMMLIYLRKVIWYAEKISFFCVNDKNSRIRIRVRIH